MWGFLHSYWFPLETLIFNSVVNVKSGVSWQAGRLLKLIMLKILAVMDSSAR